MENNIPVDIRWLIEVKIQLARELHDWQGSYIPYLLLTYLVVGKETIQENEKLDGSKFLVISVLDKLQQTSL